MFTVYNEDEDRYDVVEEPDPSVNYTYADYVKWQFKERLELIRGKIFRMSPAPNTIHQQVLMKIGYEFYAFLKGKTCSSFVAPFDVRLPVKNKKKDNEIYTVVQPDVFIVCDESKIDARGCCGAPDLVIEILSPGNSKKEVRLKFELYEEAGVKEYWIISPAEENLVVFILNDNGEYGKIKMYTGGDVLTTTILPGYKINVNEIFIK
jgi:Uma2 family endonuclease